ncbi:MAG: FtsQ-type POTRA domain-containing protein [Actinobacteria bacterium]|jgi:cell division protein FtsQ|nr:MAG: FtsQ-type POTRA domain-containing protein [Actinomycetota bacterium]
MQGGKRKAVKNKTAKTRGAEVRVSRAKTRVVAKKKAAPEIRKPRRTDGGRAQAEPESGQDGNAPPRRAARAPEAPQKKEAMRSVKAQRGERTEKPRRAFARREPEADTALPPRSVEDSGKKKKRGSKGALSPQENGVRQPEEGAGARAAGEASGGKKEKRISRHVRILILGGLLLVSLAALLWVYTATGTLNVAKVEVRGNEVLDADYLRSLSGITRDTHLLKMDVKAVESAILSEPYVAGVDVSRQYPNTVVLQITERKPSAFIIQNGKFNLVDQEGMILESADAMPPGLIEIRDLDTQLLFPGMEVSGLDFATVTSLLGSLPPALREITTAVGLGAKGLYLEGKGTLVIYGEASELPRKNTIALLALSGLVDRYGAVEYIDVSFPDHPVIKPVGAG